METVSDRNIIIIIITVKSRSLTDSTDFNTTLPHPDADLSPNATISADDLSVEQAMKRRRLSMLTKHRRTVSQASSIGGASISGVLSIMSAYMPATPVTDAHHIVGGGGTGPQHQLPDAPGGPASDSSAASKASASYARGAGGGGYDTPPLSPSSGQGTSVDGERRGSGGRLRRWLSSRR